MDIQTISQGLVISKIVALLKAHSKKHNLITQPGYLGVNWKSILATDGAAAGITETYDTSQEFSIGSFSDFSGSKLSIILAADGTSRWWYRNHQHGDQPVTQENIKWAMERLEKLKVAFLPTFDT